MTSIDRAWLNTLSIIMAGGASVSPRGKLTYEIPQNTMVVDMNQPVLLVPERKLSYQFMAAEAYWILSGDNKAENIVPYNKHIGHFSDDGVTFYGAYGPRIAEQLDYVVNKLLDDPDTRQAGLTIWIENPQPTKDVPCTVAMFFGIRNSLLNAHVFMRSSDAWLGVPYDVFNFSMLAHLICARLNKKMYRIVEPGTLFLTAASAHIYETNFADVGRIIHSHTVGGSDLPRPVNTPTILHRDESVLMQWLKDLRDTKPGDKLRWWEAS